MISRWLLPFVLLSLLWIGISNGDAASWVVGLPTILLATLSFRLLSPTQMTGVRLREFPSFTVWFLWHSLRGGIDVAGRAFQPRMPLNPGFIRYKLTITQEGPRVFLANCLSLLPGTLCVDIEGDILLLHALDTDAAVLEETRKAEQQVAKLYGLMDGFNHD